MNQPKTLDEILAWFEERRDTEQDNEGYGVNPKPIPATLDAIAALMPVGWKWRRGYQVWVATKTAEAPMLGFEFDIPDTGNELLDRATLAYLAQIEQDRNTKQEDDDGN